MTAKLRKQIENYVRRQRWTPQDFYFKHALQVRDFAVWLQKEIGGDRDVVEAASLLHDVGKAKLLAPGHEKASEQIAKEFLERIGFAPAKIPRVLECVRYENFESLEAKILRSADSLGLLMDDSGGREWYFKTVLKNDRNRIRRELRKSYSELGFGRARELAAKNYERLLKR